MAGAVFGEVRVSLFVAGAVFGEVQVSLFVAGAVFGEIWNDSRSAKCCIFQYKMLVVGVKSNLGCEAGCGLTVSWSDHARIMVGSFSDRPRIGNDVSSVFSRLRTDGFMVGSCSDHGRIILGSWSDRPRIGNDVSSVFSKFL